jgi:hypothetical protein
LTYEQAGHDGHAGQAISSEHSGGGGHCGHAELCVPIKTQATMSAMKSFYE